jgi:diguanylate cyclase (GGDEF)-like protein
VSEQAPELPTRFRVLLLGEASARPLGLERELARAGFQLVDREDLAGYSDPDAILITLADLPDPPADELLGPGQNHGSAPRLVVLSRPNPDGPAAALALGAADALVAPIHFPELCARLSARIREHRKTGGRPEAATAGIPGSNGLPEGSAGSKPTAEILEQRVQEEFERARRYSLSFSLILLGVDELQDSEQRQGPEAAARLREEVTQTLRRELRVPDLVAPYGSGEFAIVLPETGQSGARQSLIRVRERLTSLPFEGDPRFGSARFSAGIVTFPHPAAFQPDDLFAMAEAALMRGRAQSSERIGVAV